MQGGGADHPVERRYSYHGQVPVPVLLLSEWVLVFDQVFSLTEQLYKISLD